jgi:hypothetical protein
MSLKKHAQSGLEYLVTYGWAIFILLIVVAVLWYMGVFDSISFAGPSNPSSGFSSFKYVDHKVNLTGAVVMLNNAVTRGITITDVTVGVADFTDDTDCKPLSPEYVGPNGNTTITCTSLPQGLIPVVKEYYELTVTITFTDSVSGKEHIDIGFVRGKISSS